MTEPLCVPLRVPDLERSLKLYVHGEEDRFVSAQLRREGLWEPYETSLLCQLLQPGDVFVDAGANIGYFSLIGAQRVGVAGAVFAFEPDPGHCRLIRASAALNRLAERITVVEAGLAERDGQGQLYLSAENLGDHQIFTTAEERPCIPISLCSGADYLRPRVTRMDLLKVDTQGSEWQVMAGLLPLLKELPYPPRVILELTPFSLREAGSSGRQLVRLLSGISQDIAIIDHIEHRVVAVTPEALSTWCDNVDATANDRGFMNILVGKLPAGLA
ncbi:MAG: FkbM family methyltransferase [Pseudomonadota bacterium]